MRAYSIIDSGEYEALRDKIREMANSPNTGPMKSDEMLDLLDIIRNNIGSGGAGGGGDTGGINFEDYIQGNLWGMELNLPNIEYLKSYAFAGLSVTKVNIPNVISLNDGVFYNCWQLAEVDLPENLFEIPNKAFAQSPSFNTSSLPNSVHAIYHEAFSGCTSLTLSTLPTNLKIIYGSAFQNSGIAVTELPQQLEEIWHSAFGRCENLAITTIPASVKFVKGYAFEYCPQLTSITFESKPEELEWGIFEGCENLTTINVPWSIDDPINGDGSWHSAPNAIINYNYVGDAE